MNTSFGVVYLDNVLKVTTVDGLENYSFFANIDDQNPLTFYNLIVKFNNQQLVEPPFLRRYTMTSTFYASYSQGLEGLETFQGTLEKIFITETLAIGDLIKSTGGDCPPQDVNPPPGGGTGDPTNPGDPGDGTGGGDPGGGETGGWEEYQCTTVTNVSYCNGGLYHTDPNDPNCYGSIKGATYTYEQCEWVWVQAKSMKSTTTCPDPDGPVGMLPDPTDPSITDECNKINDYLDPTKHDVKPTLTELVNKANNSDKEHGKVFSMTIEIGPDPDQVSYQYSQGGIIEGTSTNIDFPLGTGKVSSAHSHPLGTEPVPSFGDLYLLWETYEASSSFPADNIQSYKPFVSIFIVMPSGVAYSLSVKDIAVLGQKLQDKLSSSDYSHLTTTKEKIEEIHREMGRELSKNQNSKEKYFMQKFGDYGINVSRSDPNNFDNWTYLELKDGAVNETPCN